MSWFRKPEPAPVVEQCPVFVMNGEAVVDVFYMPMRGEPLQGHLNWVPVGAIEFEVTGTADRAIIESPAGCYEMRYPMVSGALLTIGREGAGNFTRCQRINSKNLQPEMETDIVPV